MLNELLEAVNCVEAATMPREPFLHFDELTISEPVVDDKDFVIDDSELIVFRFSDRPALTLEFESMWENL